MSPKIIILLPLTFLVGCKEEIVSRNIPSSGFSKPVAQATTPLREEDFYGRFGTNEYLDNLFQKREVATTSDEKNAFEQHIYNFLCIQQEKYKDLDSHYVKKLYALSLNEHMKSDIAEKFTCYLFSRNSNIWASSNNPYLEELFLKRSTCSDNQEIDGIEHLISRYFYKQKEKCGTIDSEYVSKLISISKNVQLKAKLHEDFDIYLLSYKEFENNSYLDDLFKKRDALNSPSEINNIDLQILNFVMKQAKYYDAISIPYTKRLYETTKNNEIKQKLLSNFSKVLLSEEEMAKFNYQNWVKKRVVFLNSTKVTNKMTIPEIRTIFQQWQDGYSWCDKFDGAKQYFSTENFYEIFGKPYKIQYLSETGHYILWYNYKWLSDMVIEVERRFYEDNIIMARDFDVL